ncbi:MAG: DUF2815 family protein [Paludibacteraceae bacterium]|nr:DUF2815 family protein [Paludibacteraceae bacterium]
MSAPTSLEELAYTDGLTLPENLILDPMDCGSGDYCNVSVNFYGFAASGNKGIAAGLGNIQKVRTGERLAGRATAASDFTEIDAEDDAEEAFAENDLPDYLN